MWCSPWGLLMGILRCSLYTLRSVLRILAPFHVSFLGVSNAKPSFRYSADETIKVPETPPSRIQVYRIDFLESRRRRLPYLLNFLINAPLSSQRLQALILWNSDHSSYLIYCQVLLCNKHPRQPPLDHTTAFKSRTTAQRLGLEI